MSAPDPIELEATTTSAPSAEPDRDAGPHLHPVPTSPGPVETPELGEETAAQDADEQRSVEDQPADESASWWSQTAHGLLARLDPPDLWHEDRPALVKLGNYARWSEQLPPSGVLRYLAIGYTAVSGVYTARDYTKTWLRERPVRAAVFAALMALAAVWAPTRAVLTVALWPAHTVLELLTNY